ncbi:MAG TPA: septum formation initiator family protein [Gemmatimonadaceae bacterium]|nr:septum formation initiator family protein [Gemmatimonadaceae bacterium]
MASPRRTARRPGTGGGAAGSGRRWLRLALWALLIGAIWFLVQGGQYSTADLFAQRGRIADLEERVSMLQREVDSLSRVHEAVLEDPAMQERIAREEFGMVRGDRELLYRFDTPRDSGPP